MAAPDFWKRLKGAFLNKRKVVIVGVGNPLRGDDGIGPYIIQNLKEILEFGGFNQDTNLELLDCGEAPENYLQPILNAKPQMLLVIDAADMGESPGTLKFFKKEALCGLSISTHNASLALFLDYVKNHSPKTEIILLLLQPFKRVLGEELSPPVRKSGENFARRLVESITRKEK